jgi:hypothetical protein
VGCGYGFGALDWWCPSPMASLFVPSQVARLCCIVSVYVAELCTTICHTHTRFGTIIHLVLNDYFREGGLLSGDAQSKLWCSKETHRGTLAECVLPLPTDKRNSGCLRLPSKETLGSSVPSVQFCLLELTNARIPTLPSLAVMGNYCLIKCPTLHHPEFWMPWGLDHLASNCA